MVTINVRFRLQRDAVPMLHQAIGSDYMQLLGLIAEEYKFHVERERRESERKKIEAEGIREFQQIATRGISDSYLRWRAYRQRVRGRLRTRGLSPEGVSPGARAATLRMVSAGECGQSLRALGTYQGRFLEELGNRQLASP